MPAASPPGRHNGGCVFSPRMARSSVALFLASASLIAALGGCGGEGAEEKRAQPEAGSRPGVAAPLQNEGGEKKTKGDDANQEQRREADSEGGEGGEGGEG